MTKKQSIRIKELINFYLNEESSSDKKIYVQMVKEILLEEDVVFSLKDFSLKDLPILQEIHNTGGNRFKRILSPIISDILAKQREEKINNILSKFEKIDSFIESTKAIEIIKNGTRKILEELDFEKRNMPEIYGVLLEKGALSLGPIIEEIARKEICSLVKAFTNAETLEKSNIILLKIVSFLDNLEFTITYLEFLIVGLEPGVKEVMISTRNKILFKKRVEADRKISGEVLAINKDD